MEGGGKRWKKVGGEQKVVRAVGVVLVGSRRGGEGRAASPRWCLKGVMAFFVYLVGNY